jgi:hypothetical protein
MSNADEIAQAEQAASAAHEHYLAAKQAEQAATQRAETEASDDARSALAAAISNTGAALTAWKKATKRVSTARRSARRLQTNEDHQ